VACDIEDEDSIAGAAAFIEAEGPLDLVICATGMLQRLPDIRPERSWRTMESAAMAKVMAVNTIGPALVAKHFLPLLARDRRSVFAALSARVGSIEDNRLGGWHSYRASKAALNMLIRNFAIELGRRNPMAICVALHPGTVDTPLSEPFQGNVAADKLFSSERSATALLSVIDGLTSGDSGGFFAWDGQPIPY
jgi:NAD(P)-dependent dehydrogenase (short-subunit alcohol dehydrogenase family)